MFVIDDYVFPYPCQIERVAELRASEVSGMLLDRSWFNDVLGTYLRYSVALAVPPDEAAAYERLYGLLTDPVDGHRFALPYNSGTVQLTGRVEGVSDALARLPGGGQYWRSVKFTVIANHPKRSYALSEALSRGLSALPDAASPELGDTYTYTSEGWVKQ